MTEKLHVEVLELRKLEKVSKVVVNTKAKQLMEEHYPDITTFNASDGWLNQFSRKNISFQRKTNSSQKRLT